MFKNIERKYIMNIFMTFTDFLSEIYGENCEIVLHEITEEGSSIIAIKNGHISNRAIGIEKDDVLKKQIEISKGNSYSANRFHKTIEGGDMKSNSFFIKDSSGELIGILCVNIDLSSIITLNKITEKFLSEFMNNTLNNNHKVNEEEETIEEYTYRIMKKIVNQSDVPVDRMNMEEKIEILRLLKEKGVFRIKGVVREVAKQLDVSETSIYRYLREIE
ncbi:helix-turn-helix transcriptional regulator [Sedimentibacter sp. MB31-C6]|uniref:helix-turn-helix transcriptional regulator n=1 Tax=Sedimentibacter sp. MB31-C6 TaxID=3109366 RepID=UPI002DDD6434|nr:PAS domain-containing protein [Sedimentibacter sp. MB36-C1]WSI04791.1 PAS domain-containing protein [Sedimentibacter sp. MB36-C1]